MGAREFTAVLGGASGDRPTVEIPFDVKAEYGSARAKVVATVNGVELRTTVAVYGGTLEMLRQGIKQSLNP